MSRLGKGGDAAFGEGGILGAGGIFDGGPNFLLKIIPHVDGSPRFCELVEYHLLDIDIKGAWTGPAALSLQPHALAPVADLPVLEVVSAIHVLSDLTLGLGQFTTI